MRAVVQRVHWAEVRVEGRSTGRIGSGLLVFLGVEKSDTPEDGDWLANKVVQLRCFEDPAGRMNRNLPESGGEALVVSQFTLYGSLRKGSRPSFNRAAGPELAVPLYASFVAAVEAALGRPVPTGVFGAHMDIEALNDGPVTLIIDSRQKEL